MILEIAVRGESLEEIAEYLQVIVDKLRNAELESDEHYKIATSDSNRIH